MNVVDVLLDRLRTVLIQENCLLSDGSLDAVEINKYVKDKFDILMELSSINEKKALELSVWINKEVLREIFRLLQENEKLLVRQLKAVSFVFSALFEEPQKSGDVYSSYANGVEM